MSLRILHVNTELAWRGGERQIDLLVRYANSSVAHFIACHPKGALFQRLQANQQVIGFEMANGLDLKAAFRLNQLCRKYQIDVLHAHTPKAHTLAVISRLLGNRTPIVVTKRTSFPVKNNFFSKYKYRKADQVVCVSEASGSALKSQLPSLDIRIIPSAIEKVDQVDKEVIHRTYPDTNNQMKVGYVAALTEEKNPEVFFQVAQKVLEQRSDVVFLWIGEGRLHEEMAKRIRQAGLEKQIMLPGFQSDIQSWMASLDVLFFPSLIEGYPTTLLDAMQHGVPVVASDIPGIRNIIRHQENGMLSDPHNPGEFTEAVNQLLTDEALRIRLINNGRQSLHGRLAEDMAAAYLLLYEELV